jgi:MerR family transcriptional regulator, mercuric resistance operon regulatory protein
MTIAGLAREGGVGVETIRYYQRRGLLEVPERPAGPGSRGSIRQYGDADVERLRFVRSAKAAGFSLDEVANLLQLNSKQDRAAVRALARHRIAQLDI